uniref:Uncharacterized protein n=1 Tax=Anguilla anguilla TaxID=7936 RepID=A0A0E9UXX9_ANGAN
MVLIHCHKIKSVKYSLSSFHTLRPLVIGKAKSLLNMKAK